MVVKLGIEIELASAPTTATNAVLRELNGRWVQCGDGSLKCKHNAGTVRYGFCSRCDELGITDTEFKTSERKPYTVNLNDISASADKIALDFKRILATLENVSANSSCGIHFHFSGIKKYAVFYSNAFLAQLKERYLRFARTEEERARFDNKYAEWCDFFHVPHNGERYRALNIRGAYEKHKTFEFRFFASTDNIPTLRRYIIFVLEILKEVSETTYSGIKKDITVNEKKTECVITRYV